MSPFTTTLGCLLALVAAQAPDHTDRDRDDGARRILVVNGTHSHVYYFPNSQGTAESYRELERAENENYIAQDLQYLRSQYIRDENYLQPIRRQIQERLYGANVNMGVTSNSSSSQFYPNNYMSSFTPLTSPVSASGFPLGGGFQSLPTSGFPVPRNGGSLQNQITPSTITPTSNSFFPTSSGMGTGVFMPSPMTSVTSAMPGGAIFTNGGMGLGGGFFNPFGLGGLGASSLFGGLGASSLFGGLGGGALFGGAGSFNPYFSLYGSRQASSTTTMQNMNYSLANGMGDEGRIKTAMAQAMALQSGPDYQQRVRADLRSARAAVGRHTHVAVTLRDGEKQSGRLVQQTGDWIVIRNGDEEHYIRTADIARMTKRTISDSTTARRGR